MTAIDDQTYGFIKGDAIELVNSIGNREIEHYQRVPRDDTGSGAPALTGVVTDVGTETAADLAGLEFADVFVIESSDPSLLATSVRVHDRKGCIFDIDVTNYCVWAHEVYAITMDDEKECTEVVKYWAADDRCCDPNTAIYRECEDEEEDE